MSDGLGFRGTYEVELRRGGETSRSVTTNTLTWEAVTSIFREGLANRVWLVGFKDGGEGSADDTTVRRLWSPAPVRLDGVRPVWTPNFTVPGMVTNRANPAMFYIDQDTPVDGIYIASEDGRVLLSVAEWCATQELREGDELSVTYTLEAVLE